MRHDSLLFFEIRGGTRTSLYLLSGAFSSGLIDMVLMRQEGALMVRGVVLPHGGRDLGENEKEKTHRRSSAGNSRMSRRLRRGVLTTKRGNKNERETNN